VKNGGQGNFHYLISRERVKFFSICLRIEIVILLALNHGRPLFSKLSKWWTSSKWNTREFSLIHYNENSLVCYFELVHSHLIPAPKKLVHKFYIDASLLHARKKIEARIRIACKILILASSFLNGFFSLKIMNTINILLLTTFWGCFTFE
jgi:hypothetical protein